MARPVARPSEADGFDQLRRLNPASSARSRSSLRATGWSNVLSAISNFRVWLSSGRCSQSLRKSLLMEFWQQSFPHFHGEAVNILRDQTQAVGLRQPFEVVAQVT